MIDELVEWGIKRHSNVEQEHEVAVITRCFRGVEVV
jgi:hypothetical protein